MKKEEKINKIIELNEEGYSLNKICEILGIKYYQNIQQLLRRNKIKLQYNNKGNIFSRNKYFSNINSEVKAYLLGFFYADGCISKHKYGDRIDFCCTDLEFLIKIKEILKKQSIFCSIYTTKGKTVIFYRLQSTDIQSPKKFFKYIYKDSKYFLQRKFDKFNTEISS